MSGKGTVRASTSTHAKRNRAYAEAVERLLFRGWQMLNREDKAFPRFTEAEFMYGRTLMWTYFFGSCVPQGDKRVESDIRFSFALACLKQNLNDLPGQRYGWYREYLRRARKYLESRETTPD